MEGRGIHTNCLKHQYIAEQDNSIGLTEPGDEDKYQTKML